MATIKKTAAKPAATKKPAAKTASKAAAPKTAAPKATTPKAAAPKAAAPKTATPKAAAKTAAAKPAAKKSAAKTAAKPAAKTAAPKAAPKAATKTAAAKPAAKKPAAKTAAKPAAKAAAGKATAGKAAAKKPASKKAEKPDMKFRNLFDAFAQGKLPFTHGYIVSSFFSEKTNYSIYEIVSYAGVKEIFPTSDGLTFVTGGKKLFVLVEHDTYQLKFQEPVSRSEGERIPKRFAELEIITARNQYKVMVSKEAIESYGSFTILKPTGINFSVVFYDLPDVLATLSAFFIDSLNRIRKVPESDAKKASQIIAATVKKSMGFDGEFMPKKQQ